jgi:hypothetical protein
MPIGLTKPIEQPVAPQLSVGTAAPELPGINWSKPTFITFLRHGGCPFAEATIKAMRPWTSLYPNIQFVAVTHGEQSLINSWLAEIGGAGDVTLIHDAERTLHGNWGIGYSTRNHFLGPGTIFRALGLIFQGIRNRADTGTRWQRSAAFLVDAQGRVRWQQLPDYAYQLPSIEAALHHVEF